MSSKRVKVWVPREESAYIRVAKREQASDKELAQRMIRNKRKLQEIEAEEQAKREAFKASGKAKLVTLAEAKRRVKSGEWKHWTESPKKLDEMKEFHVEEDPDCYCEFCIGVYGNGNIFKD
jgi:hypothetical protein